jgi:hypothetical protein
LSAEAPLCESIARLGISTRKLTAGGDLYLAAAEKRWHNFAAANYSRLSFHTHRAVIFYHLNCEFGVNHMV